MALPGQERSWGAAISRFGPFPRLVIAGGLDGVARPDLGLHALVEAMSIGASIEVTLPNVGFADHVVALLHGDWPDTLPRRFFTRESATILAEECGLTVDELVDHPHEPADRRLAADLLGDRLDVAASFTLRCRRTRRGMIAPPQTFAESVDYTTLFQRGDGTCHSREIELLAGRPRVVEVAPAADMTHWLSDLGHRMTVVDRAVPSRSRTWAERVVVGDLDVDDWAASVEGGADAVLLGNVIEHVADPVAVLRAAARCLDRSSVPAPVVVVSVPNVAHADVRLALASGRWTYRDTGILDRTHLHFFTAARLAEAAAAAGLDVVERPSTRVPRGASVNAVGWEPGATEPARSPAPTGHDRPRRRRRRCRHPRSHLVVSAALIAQPESCREALDGPTQPAGREAPRRSRRRPTCGGYVASRRASTSSVCRAATRPHSRASIDVRRVSAAAAAGVDRRRPVGVGGDGGDQGAFGFDGGVEPAGKPRPERRTTLDHVGESEPVQHRRRGVDEFVVDRPDR